MSAHCELCDETLGDGWCGNCAREANKRSNGAKAFNSAQEVIAAKDSEIDRLRWALEFYACPPNWNVPALGHERSPVGLDGGDIARRALEPDVSIGTDAGTPNQAAGPTLQPRSEVSGSKIPGNHSGDPE